MKKTFDDLCKDLSLYRNLRNALYVPAKLDAVLPRRYELVADDYDKKLMLNDRYMDRTVITVTSTDDGWDEPEPTVYVYPHAKLYDVEEDLLCDLLLAMAEVGKTVSEEDKAVFKLPVSSGHDLVREGLRETLANTATQARVPEPQAA